MFSSAQAPCNVASILDSARELGIRDAQPIAVISNQLARGPQEAIDWIGQIAGGICSIHWPSGCGWIPAMCGHAAGLQLDHEEDDQYRRRPARVSTSTVKRSAAARPCVPSAPAGTSSTACAGSAREPGQSPWSCKIRLTVFRAMSSGRGWRARRGSACSPTSDSPPPSVRRVRPCAALGRHRPSPTPAGTAIVLLGDQPPVPAENRVRPDDALPPDSRSAGTEFLASHRESRGEWASVRRSGRGPRCSPEDAILLLEIVDAIFLAGELPSQRQGQHEEGRHERGAWPEVTWLRHGRHPRCLGDLTRPGRFLAPYGSAGRPRL